MFDIGFWELALIFVLALLVLGPQRLPKLASQLGNWAGQARRMARLLTTQLRQEIDAVDPTRQFEDLVATKPPPRQTYQRPGMEGLRPGSTAEDSEPKPDVPARSDAADNGAPT
jgi:sec-independent protein translocase protein TatB